MSHKPVKVGIIGCGEVAQVIHIPTLNQMHERFEITYLCGKSANALELCSKRVFNHVPKTTADATTLCASVDVEVVFVLSSDELHTGHVILALGHGKHVFVEKPMAMTEADARSIIEAEKKSKGKVFVGYMRRYAAAFVDAVKEIGGLDNILYARVRDIIGPNSIFIAQSATFPKRFSDYTKDDIDQRAALAEQIAQQGLLHECGVEATPDSITQYRVLGGLGSHDLSAMREVFGMPESVIGSSLGFHDIPFFDAHIEVYSQHKSVRVQYDTPYIKGLPTTMHIRESVNGGLQETNIRKTYEDPFTLQMKELYAMIAEGKPIKTTAEDSLKDLRIFQMIMRSASKNTC